MNTRSLFLAAGLVTGLLAGLSGTAFATDRYADRPPVVVSPDLSNTWLMQLRSPNTPAPTYASQPGYADQTVQQSGAQRSGVMIGFEQPRRAPMRRGFLDGGTGAAAAPQTAQVAGMRVPVIRGRLDPQFLPQIVHYETKEKPGTIVIDTNNRFLYLVMENGEARRYGVGVGKPGFEWAGVHTITRKAEWPEWIPPQEMITREAAKGHYLPARMEGGPANPLGARAMYLGSTLYRIHGTNAPWTIGSAESSGCIRMRNEDVTDLYGRVGVGTRVIVI